MAAESELSLLDRRLVIVTGKGGTGKTSVAAALALVASQRGKRVLVVEVGLHEHLPRLLDPRAPLVGYAGRDLRPGLTAMRIDPFEAMAEYLGMQFGARAVVDLTFRNRSLRQLLEGAPGWRELITLGKIWHLDQMREKDGTPRFDLIVVDAPATGHGVTFLDVPRVVHSAVRSGPLSRNAGMVEAMIRDAAHTLLLPVSLAEELPAQETHELVTRVREEIGIAVDRVVINAVARPPFPPDCPDLDERLAALPADLGFSVLPSADILARCSAYLVSRWRLNRSYVGSIGKRTGLPVVCLPYLPGGLRERGALEQLSEALLVAPSSAVPVQS